MQRLKISGIGNLSPHLSKREVFLKIREKSRQAADQIGMNAVLPDLFELFRYYSGGEPVGINSAFREFTPSGGVEDSAHRRFNALDLGMTTNQIKKLKRSITEWFPKAYSMGLRGLGIYSWGIHIDTEDKNIKYQWSPDKGLTFYDFRYWDENTPDWLTRGGKAGQTTIVPRFASAIGDDTQENDESNGSENRPDGWDDNTGDQNDYEAKADKNERSAGFLPMFIIAGLLAFFLIFKNKK